MSAVDELHAAIDAYLREQRRTAEVRRPQADAERHRTQLERDAQILALWREHRAVPSCIVCGQPVDNDGGLFSLADMQISRQCFEHYCSF